MLSVIVPTYAQEATIEDTVRTLDRGLTKLSVPFEVIIVVDGQQDKTFERAQKLAGSHIRVVGYVHNHGKGYAVRYGMARARGDTIAFIDAGGDILVSSIGIVLEYFRWQHADIVVGSKRHPLSKVRYPHSRKLLSLGYQLIVRILFGLNVSDTQVGLKVYKRQVLEDVLPRLLVKRFAFDIEILAVAHHLGYTRIFEAPVQLDFTGVSSITSLNFLFVALRMFWDTLAVFYRLKLLNYYDNINKRKWRFDPELNFRINIG